MTTLLGDRLVALCENATEPLLLVAPFIKADVFARVLSATPAGVAITCVTRWRPEEVAAGVSDLEIFDQARGRSGTRIFLHPHLHAKLYRSGAQGLLGSANLTGKALGWVQPANLELFVEVDPSTAELQAFEAELFGYVQPADSSIRDAVAAAAAALASSLPRPPAWTGDLPGDQALTSMFWLPTCPRPDLLFRIYDETIGDHLLSNARKLGEQDLAFLSAPPGLAETVFSRYVAAMLRQVRWIQELDKLTGSGLTDTVAAETIAQNLSAQHDFSPENLWSVTKEWLVHFFPGQYDRVPAGEMLRKSRREV